MTLSVPSAGGHAAVVRLLLEKNADINTQGGEYGSALQAASAGVMVQLWGCSWKRMRTSTCSGGRYGSALQVASASGYVAVVRLLLENDADVNAQGGRYGSELQVASAGGHAAVDRLLLEKDTHTFIYRPRSMGLQGPSPTNLRCTPWGGPRSLCPPYPLSCQTTLRGGRVLTRTTSQH